MAREHGTNAKYHLEGCRCDRCIDAARTYQRGLRRRVAPAYVGADPVRRHVKWLSSQGVGATEVCRASGVSHGALSKLLYGDPQRGQAPSMRVRPSTAEAIMAVTPADGAPGSFVPAGPTRAVVDRLVARGWTKMAIARALGQTGTGLQLGDRYVTRRSARIVKGLLDRPVPPRRSRYGTVYRPEPKPDLEPVRMVDDDRDNFIRKMAEILEERIDQASWRRQAACRGTPTWMWFPTRGDHQAVAAARKVCAKCPVRVECFFAGLRSRREGIYAGLTPRQRRQRGGITEVAA